MKSKLILLLSFIFLSLNGIAQSSIIVTFNDNSPATIELLNGADKLTNTGSMNFTDGRATIKIINKTLLTTFRVDFKDPAGNPVFNIPGTQITAKASVGAPDAVTNFTIQTDGTLVPAVTSSKMTPGIGIIATTPDVANKATIAAISPGKPRKGTKSAGDNELYKYVEKMITNRGYTYLAGQNLIIDDEGVIHIFLDENGSPVYSYFPVAAKENSDKFQFHILSKDGIGYTIESTGEFNPIEISEEIPTNVAKTESDGGGTKRVKYKEYQSPKFGPFTGTFPFTITKNSTDELIVDRTVKLLKTSRVSLGTSVIATWLKNPESIATFRKPNGDTTLIADNPNIRGFLGLFLTFHFIPRNLNIQPRKFQERLGISVGTNLTSTAFNNFYLGLNVEITNGLFINGGLNYGQVNYVVNYDKFTYDKDVFSGVLQTKKKWVIGGPYVSINIDAKLFANAFANILGTAAR